MSEEIENNEATLRELNNEPTGDIVRTDVPIMKASDIPSPEEQAAKNKANREAILAAFKIHWIKRYGLEGIDLKKELELIKKKQSKLSRSKRDAVQQFFMLFPVAQEFVNIESKKEEEDAKE